MNNMNEEDQKTLNSLLEEIEKANLEVDQEEWNCEVAQRRLLQAMRYQKDINRTLDIFKKEHNLK